MSAGWLQAPAVSQPLRAVACCPRSGGCVVQVSFLGLAVLFCRCACCLLCALQYIFFSYCFESIYFLAWFKAAGSVTNSSVFSISGLHAPTSQGSVNTQAAGTWAGLASCISWDACDLLVRGLGHGAALFRRCEAGLGVRRRGATAPASVVTGLRRLGPWPLPPYPVLGESASHLGT